jgi:hypothetical protein
MFPAIRSPNVITFGQDNKKFMPNRKTDKESSQLFGFFYPSAREVAPIRLLRNFIPNSQEPFSLENNPKHILRR